MMLTWKPGYSSIQTNIKLSKFADRSGLECIRVLVLCKLMTDNDTASNMKVTATYLIYEDDGRRVFSS